MRDAWRLAVGTLTAVPVAAPSRVDRQVAAHSVLLGPLAVLPVAGAAAVVLTLGWLAGLAPLATGSLAVAVLALGTRAFHLDGLADTADGLTASYDAERTLAVMRTGDTGPAGAAALAVVLLAQVAGLSSLATLGPTGAALAGGLVCLSRWSHAAACRRGVPTAAAGLGATHAETLPTPLVLALAVAAAGLASLGCVAAGLPWWRGILGVGLATVAVTLVVRRAVRRVGGVTGDVMGASIEVGLACLLVAVS